MSIIVVYCIDIILQKIEIGKKVENMGKETYYSLEMEHVHLEEKSIKIIIVDKLTVEIVFTLYKIEIRIIVLNF